MNPKCSTSIAQPDPSRGPVARRKRRSGLVITGGVVPPETLAPNAAHPLARLDEAGRSQSAIEALARLIAVDRAQVLNTQIQPNDPTNSGSALGGQIKEK